jgi:ketosteroid isomerase-like protein
MISLHHRRKALAHSRILWVVLLMAVCSFGQTAVAASKVHRTSKRDLKREVEALEEQWRSAQVTGDIAAMDQLMSDDFVGISMTGQANTKDQQLDRYRNRRLVLTKIDLSDSKVKLVGSVAIVTSLATVEGSNEGTSMTGIYRYTRIYQLLPSGMWKTTNFEATRVPTDRRGPSPSR